jgi:hypothetical protein
MALMSFSSPLSFVGFRSRNRIAAEGLLDEVNKLNPEIDVTNLADGKALSFASAWFRIFVVPSRDVPEGVETEMAINPWSSVGMKPDFVVLTR